MRLIIEPNYDLMSQWAANYVVDRINAAKPTKEKPFVLGLPTGSSPIGMYRGLVKAYQEGRVSFKNVLTFNMDEYVGLPEEHPESYHSFMFTNLFNHIDCPKENIHILNGNAKDLAAECAHYEQMIEEAGGIDLFLRYRPRRPHRFQRAGFKPYQPHPSEDADHRYHYCQQPFLRQRYQQGAQDRSYRWRRHGDGCQGSDDSGERTCQVPRSAGCCGGFCEPHVDHLGPSDAPAWHHRCRRCRL